MLALARETRRAFAGQPVLHHQLAGQGQHEGDDGDRDRPADAVGGDDEGDAGLGAGLHVHRVVADSEARHHGEAPVGMNALLGEAMGKQDEGVEIGQLVGAQRIDGIEIGHLHARRLLQGREVEIREDGRAIGFPEIAREGDAKWRAHHFFPIFLGGQPWRSLPMASASALCSTHTSPE